MSFKNDLSHSSSNTAKGFAIQVKELSKYYRLYEKPQDRLKESIYSALNRLVGREPVTYCREFEALSNVSFEVNRGETIAIIGSNGSGKSTLLQMICGTLSPTIGTIEVNGRVAALLELGSGFNPEFTGRENVYMNATIFGMAAKEVDEKFAEIVEFADIGEFLEQPVKTYSTGMMLRLAFAVVAHVNADILVIDEALSVGDAVFTQKCMRFIKSFQQKGTLLFVSHDMSAVQNLCQNAIWLEKGAIKMMGASRDVTNAYLQSTLQTFYGDEHQLESIAPGDTLFDASDAGNVSNPPLLDYDVTMAVRDNMSGSKGWKTGGAEVLNAELSNLENVSDRLFRGGEKVRMTIKAIAHQPLESPILGFIVKDRLGQDLFGENTLSFASVKPAPVSAGQAFKAEFDFVLPMLPNGEYVVMASVADGTLYDNIQHHYLHDALVITVSCSKVRWGLTGILFDRVSMETTDG
jgi:lipopolysaccharide transport system ATP-binding protein